MQHAGIRATPTRLRKDIFYKLMKHPSTSKVGWIFGKIVFFKEDTNEGTREEVNIFRKCFSLFSQVL